MSGRKSPTDGDTVSGTILFLILCLLVLTALLRSRGAAFYKLFYHTHYLYIAYLFFIMVHCTWLYPWFTFIGLLMLVDRGVDFFLYTSHSTLITSRPFQKKITLLSVPNTNAYCFSGSYYRIKIPALSTTEWHPFSLAGSANSSYLTFLIAPVGDWTRGLLDLVSGDARVRDGISVQVQGPFCAPAKHILQADPKEMQVCIASGEGGRRSFFIVPLFNSIPLLSSPPFFSSLLPSFPQASGSPHF